MSKSKTINHWFYYTLYFTDNLLTAISGDELDGKSIGSILTLPILRGTAKSLIYIYDKEVRNYRKVVLLYNIKIEM